MRKVILLIFFIILAINFYANDTYVNYNPDIAFPIIKKSESIRLLREKIVYSNNTFYTVFFFSNSTSLTQNIEIGFPIKGYFLYNGPGDIDIAEGEGASEKEIKEMIKQNIINHFKFKTFVDGAERKRKIFVNYEKNRSISSMFVMELSFAPEELKVISNIYNYPPDRISGYEIDKNIIEYIWKSGNAWKNGIERVECEFYIPKNKNTNFNIDHNYFRFHYDIPIFPFFQYYISFKPNVFNMRDNTEYFIIYCNLTNYIPLDDIKIEWGYESFTNFSFLTVLYENSKKGDFTIFTNNYNEIHKIFSDIDGIVSFLIAYNELVTKDVSDKVLRYGVVFQSNDFINEAYNALTLGTNNDKWSKYFYMFDWYKNGQRYNFSTNFIIDFNKYLAKRKDEYKMEILFKKGIEYYKNKMTDEAIRIFHYIEKDDYVKGLFYYIGNCYMDKNEYMVAIEYYNNSIKKMEFIDKSYYNLACAYSLLGDLRKSEKMLKKAFENGYTNILYIQRDKDLENLRKSKKWNQLYNYLNKFIKK
ncbi:MAG: tetratricopeptide repeat protein [Brevinematales bacterium]|nr:tetratricopeptide repeat protein [Brevinematales bacterium]